MDNAALDVAIGLSLFLGALSLLVAIVVQLLADALRLRGRMLKRGLAGLIDDPAVRSAFYEHGLMAGAVAAAGGRHPAALAPRSAALALLGCLDDKRAGGTPDFAKLVARLPESGVKDVLLAHLPAAPGDIAALRDGLAAWFDDGMRALSPSFRLRMRLLSLAAAAVMIPALNADSLEVVQALWSDRALSGEMLQASSQSFGADRTSSHPDKAAAGGVYSGTTLAYLKGMDRDIRPLPAGWGDAASRQPGGGVWAFWIGRAAGWLISILAAGFGAGLCFDLGRRLGSRRDRPVLKAGSC